MKDGLRLQKNRFKVKHYYNYKTDKERLLKRSKEIALEKFKGNVERMKL